MNNIQTSLNITVLADDGVDPYIYKVEQFNESVSLLYEHRSGQTNSFEFGTYDEAEAVARALLFAVKSIKAMRGIE